MTAMITKLEGKRLVTTTRSFVPAISLRKAARVMGGREKPWAAVFGALIDGNIKFTMPCSSSPCLIDRVLIDPADAAMLFSGHFDRNDYKHFPFVIDMARREAAELLNLNHKTTIRFAALPPPCHARDKRLVIARMLRIAAENISPSEVKARWGIEQPFGLGEKTELAWPRVNA